MVRLLSGLLAAWLVSGPLRATDSLTIEFLPLLHGQPLDAGAAAGAEFSVTAFRCYLSNVRLSGKGGPAPSEPDSYHLLDAATRANTLVTFVGDNGTPGNVIKDYPSDHGKATLYQGGVRVPTLVVR